MIESSLHQKGDSLMLNIMIKSNICKGQKRAKRPKAVMDPSPRSPNNEFVESRNKS